MRPGFAVLLAVLGFAGVERGAWSDDRSTLDVVRLTATADETSSDPFGADVQDFVFFSESPKRPVLIRLHVRVDGRPMKHVWGDFVRAVFKHLDRDGNGVLSRDEAARTPPPSLLLTGENFMGAEAGLRSAILANAKTGKCTFANIVDYYRDSGVSHFVPGRVNTQTAMAKALTDALYGRLDTNSDGKLSKDELSAAAAAIMKLDLDEDEIVAASEIVPNYNPAAGGFGAQPQPGQGGGDLQKSSFLELEPINPKSVEKLVHVLKLKYLPKEAPLSAKLTPKQIGLDAEAFQALDRNNDKLLDDSELENFFDRKPDIALILRVGERKEGELFVEKAPGERVLDDAVRLSPDGTVVIRIGNTHISFKIKEGAIRRDYDPKEYLTQLFRGFDRDGNGYLEAKETDNTSVKEVFAAMDSGRDGRVYERDFLAYMTPVEPLIRMARSNRVSIVIADEGEGLFSMLDGNRDGYLGLRELREAPNLLSELSINGGLTRKDVPRSFNFAANPGAPDYNRAGVNQRADGRPGAAPKPKTHVGPIWYRKMDRNGDGDLSPREWLGSTEQFKEIDFDGDGLISLKEAETADSELRKADAR